jgi:TonB family protein
MDRLIEFWQSSGELLLLNILLQVTLLTLLASMVARAYRNNPALRYAVLYPALLALIFIVPVSVAVQQKNLAMWQLPLGTPAAVEEAGVPTFTFEPINFVFLNINELLGVSGVASLGNSARTEGSGGNSSPAKFGDFAFSNLLLSLWLLGFAVSLFGLLRSHQKLQSIVNTAEDDDLKELRRVTKLADSLIPVVENYQIKFSSKISSPVLLGIRKPLILLPTNLPLSLTDAQLKSVLIHELAHLQRRDLVANYWQRIICSVFWFHPGVWLMDKLINRAREEICDNYVLADSDAVTYSEALLDVSSASYKLSSNKNSIKSNTQLKRSDTHFVLGMFNEDWTLEERVKGLLSDKRETAMKLNNMTSKVIQFLVISVSLFLAACQIGGETIDSSSTKASSNGKVVASYRQAIETEIVELDSEPRLISVQSTERDARSAPQTPISEKLSDNVFKMIEEIQELLLTQGESVEAEMATAKAMLDTLTIERFESLNDFEKLTALNFLTNYHLGLEEYREAAAVFERILIVENIRADSRLRTLRSLGQLYSVFEQWNESIGYYSQWRDLAAMEDQLVFKGLSYAHFQLEQWSSATQYWESYLQLIAEEGQQPNRSDYAYLNGMYFTTDDLDKALDLTKEMILLFNEQKDWDNLRILYSMLDARDQVDETVDELIGQLESSMSEPQISKTSLVPEDGDYLPLIAVVPVYPTMAANDGVEGWVLVTFTVREDGLVDGDSVAMMDAEPAVIFDRTAVEAAKQFEFKPRVVNGKAEAVAGVQYMFRFELEEEA